MLFRKMAKKYQKEQPHRMKMNALEYLGKNRQGNIFHDMLVSAIGF